MLYSSQFLWRYGLFPVSSSFRYTRRIWNSGSSNSTMHNRKQKYWGCIYKKAYFNVLHSQKVYANPEAWEIYFWMCKTSFIYYLKSNCLSQVTTNDFLSFSVTLSFPLIPEFSFLSFFCYLVSFFACFFLFISDDFLSTALQFTVNLFLSPISFHFHRNHQVHSLRLPFATFSWIINAFQSCCNNSTLLHVLTIIISALQRNKKRPVLKESISNAIVLTTIDILRRSRLPSPKCFLDNYMPDEGTLFETFFFTAYHRHHSNLFIQP